MRIARVIGLLAVALLVTQAEAGWFADKIGWGKKAAKKTSRRGGEETASTSNGQEGPTFEEEGAYDEPQEPVASKARSRQQKKFADRETRAEEMRRMRAQDKDQMLSEDYNKKIMEDEKLDTQTAEDSDYLSDDEIHKVWAEHMHDFVPEDMLNIVIESGKSFTLAEDIGHTSATTVKGAYYVVGGSKEKTVACMIYDPNRDIIYKRVASAQGIIVFDTTSAGEYNIVFMNPKKQGDIVVTFAFHTYEDDRELPVKYDIDANTGRRFEISREPVAPEDAVTDAIGGEENSAASDEQIQNVRRSLKEIQTMSKQILNEAKMSFMRQTGHNADLLDNASWNFYVMLVEVLMFGAILAYQTSHLKKTLDNKLVL